MITEALFTIHHPNPGASEFITLIRLFTEEKFMLEEVSKIFLKFGVTRIPPYRFQPMGENKQSVNFSIMPDNNTIDWYCYNSIAGSPEPWLIWRKYRRNCNIYCQYHQGWQEEAISALLADPGYFRLYYKSKVFIDKITYHEARMVIAANLVDIPFDTVEWSLRAGVWKIEPWEPFQINRVKPPMKFIVCRTLSGDMDEEGHNYGTTKENIDLTYQGDGYTPEPRTVHTKEFYSLEELIIFVENHGRVVIDRSGFKEIPFEIEIYDRFRE